MCIIQTRRFGRTRDNPDSLIGITHTAPVIMSESSDRYWETTPLSVMDPGQWESLCDGCGKCCLEKFEEEETRHIVYTNVACKLLDHDTCRCMNYARRSSLVHDCIELSPTTVEDPYWLPSTCAYRLVCEGKALPDWHPLISGNPDSVRWAGHSVAGRVIAEENAGPLIHHLIEWVE